MAEAIGHQSKYKPLTLLRPVVPGMWRVQGQPVTGP